MERNGGLAAGEPVGAAAARGVAPVPVAARLAAGEATAWPGAPVPVPLVADRTDTAPGAAGCWDGPDVRALGCAGRAGCGEGGA
jgi:hypothetical protein